MAVATWNGVEIPAVREIRQGYDLKADEQDTAGFNLRRDVIGYRRFWTLQTAPVKPDRVAPLIEAIEAVVFGEGDFWVKGLPGSVKALADPPEVTHDSLGYVTVSVTIKERIAHRG